MAVCGVVGAAVIRDKLTLVSGPESATFRDFRLGVSAYLLSPTGRLSYSETDCSVCALSWPLRSAVLGFFVFEMKSI